MQVVAVFPLSLVRVALQKRANVAFAEKRVSLVSKIYEKGHGVTCGSLPIIGGVSVKYYSKVCRGDTVAGAFIDSEWNPVFSA